MALIAKYTTNASGVIPTFNSGYQYTINETESNGVYTVEISSDSDFTSCSFNRKAGLLTVEYLKVTSNVTNMYGMFYNCSKLAQLDLSNWDTGNITNMESMFHGCSQLTQLDVSNWDTKNVTDMNDIFTNCEVKNVGLIYCPKETIDKLANCITSPCNFYVTNKTHTSPNPLVKYVMYREDKKPLLYYNPTTQAWEKPILRQWDSIEKHSDGKYYYHKRSGEVVLNGSENWKYTSLYGRAYRYDLVIPDIAYSRLALSDQIKSDRFKNIVIGTNDIEGIGHHTGSHTLQIQILDIDKLSVFKQWLQANPTTIVYQLATEKVYECTNIDLITSADETNLIVSSGVINPKASLKISKGVGNVVTTLQNKVTILEQMVYNLMKMLNNEQSNIDE